MSQECLPKDDTECAKRLSRLLDFLRRSPSPWHATANMAQRLEDAGYRHLLETDSWELVPGDRFYVTRNDSSIIAVNLPSTQPLSSLRMVGAHTDSPNLRLKTHAAQRSAGWLQLGVQVYGGALLSPWFDRDLGLAGRIHVRLPNGQVKGVLINVEQAIAIIPSLAIHLDREANDGRAMNAQTQMAPVVMQADEDATLESLLQAWLEQQHGLGDAKVLDFELGFYDLQPPSLVGLRQELIASARLDNLLSCFMGLEAMLDADGDQGMVLVANDHEEVGSASACGAQGPFLADVLKRVNGQVGEGTEEGYIRLIQSSRMISCDNAHALHPNFKDKHDAQHGPSLNGGPVIKTNANQRYATNSATAAMFRDLCEQADVPVQTFITRADMGCGSTIGPITATELGVPTLDVGVPQWAMHSIRETAGSQDVEHLTRVLTAFFNQPTLV
ncbi:M18 family aminopeptidase [Halomonas denitrificans]|uniref:M18 family aminopeptidase n=1 Tax=Halomonas TaxID=2745 RepID=UPI001C9763C9|nr:MULTISPECIES: M18 family aminopeptidase [Halomonas]MED5295644.1 M18 family aminopeptidase [Pseudomonadota bacterium]MBY5931219.1 M18 family aminopeptidase [Halomonas sp. DP8Y7-3]MBY5969119.1 M18 family aminopeptidase [Halomonas denitrificans]MBY6030960.1 M18 family aminopeptidase [Halomonas sp. DP8Y7-1]MBY6209370.1 M18 family aminopeptidase [Halomonas sp. DP3Y7-2]